MKKMNLPNRLTVLRMFMVPVFILLLLPVFAGKTHNIAAGIVFIAASLTDTLDGYLARKLNQITNFGKFMDPLADKLLVCSGLICLIELGRIPSWVVIIIVGREFIISGFRLIAAQKGVVIAAGWWGKAKTVVQMVMVIVLIFDLGGVFDTVKWVLIWASVILTIISLVDYIARNASLLGDD